MACPNCGGEMLVYPVPDQVRSHLPDDRSGASLCRRCLTVTPVDDPPDTSPDFSTISDAFPDDGADAVILASILALLDSLALYRREIEALASMAEARGIDVLLFLDRLAVSGRIQPHFDADRRRSQLEQLLE